jgi:hypothetical protein
LATKKKTSGKPDGKQTAVAPDPRATLPQGPASWEKVLAELKVVLADVPPPAAPKAGDLYEAMLHIYFADGVACGCGQEARRRITENFVDRNEFRVTEAYEVEDLLSDLPIANLFARCLAVRDSVAQIYNDQNGVNLDFLREAGVGDRNTFFVRLPALQPHVVAFLNNLLIVEELCFGEKSTLRAQQKLGMDPKDAVAQQFIAELRTLLKPYGHLPLDVGKNGAHGKPNLDHVLCPACIMVRLLPGAKKRG